MAAETRTSDVARISTRTLRTPTALLASHLQSCYTNLTGLVGCLDTAVDPSISQLEALQVTCTDIEQVLHTLSQQINDAKAACVRTQSAKENYLREVIKRIKTNLDSPRVVTKISQQIAGFCGDSEPLQWKNRGLPVKYLKASSKLFLAAFTRADQGLINNKNDMGLILSMLEHEELSNIPFVLKKALLALEPSSSLTELINELHFEPEPPPQGHSLSNNLTLPPLGYTQPIPLTFEAHVPLTPTPTSFIPVQEHDLQEIVGNRWYLGNAVANPTNAADGTSIVSFQIPGNVFIRLLWR